MNFEKLGNTNQILALASVLIVPKVIIKTQKANSSVNYVSPDITARMSG